MAGGDYAVRILPEAETVVVCIDRPLEVLFQVTRKAAISDDVRVDAEMFIVGGANGCSELTEKALQGRLAGVMAAGDNIRPPDIDP